ncbi:MAG: hypothetical protein IT204_15475 [Fimbriimonadaceae bacterium]|nr:hypothetical protein [Fimbriimonadaceae bacterium]
MSGLLRLTIVLLLLAGARPGWADPPPLSEESATCVACHETFQPGLVTDWQRSRHASTTPAAGLAKPVLQRRISATAVPAAQRDVAVGCYECHGALPDAGADRFEHFGTVIHTVVTPRDCAGCHPTEVTEYDGSKKAHAVGNLDQNPVYHGLVNTVLAPQTLRDGALQSTPPSAATRAATCFACHGTTVEVTGKRTVPHELGDFELPVLSGWPNQGVGRINPDGSRGSCSSCHARHRFDLAVARSPETCSECHLEPDTPAWEVYRESKHGNLWFVNQASQVRDAVPWRPGPDFQYPTCATCHNSLLVGPDDTVLAPRSHDFGARLWVRLFGLPYAHPQPRSGATHTIRNAAGQPLPTTLDNQPASEHLIDAATAASRQATMTKVCSACHSSTWSQGHFAKLDQTIAETNQLTLAATQLLQLGYARGRADPTNLFDESIERAWVRQWMFYANSTRYGAAMCGQDYSTFKNGWFQLGSNLLAMQDWLRDGKAKAEE